MGLREWALYHGILCYHNIFFNYSYSVLNYRIVMLQNCVWFLKRLVDTIEHD
jgi:hypothetical protein